MIANIEKSNIEEIFDLNTAQKGMLFHYLKDEGNQFNVQIVLRIEGIMDIDLLEQSIRSIQANNEVLRSVFNWEIPGKPFQIILKEIPVELTVEHFFDKLTGELPSLCNRYLDQDRQRRFDLNGLPIRFGIIKCEHNSYLMHITHHHILYDGWSTGIILKEIFSAYDMLLQKSAPALIAKPSFKEIQKAIRVKTANSPGNQFWADYMEGYELANLSSMLSGKQEKEKLKTISIIDRELDIESFSAGNKVTKASIIYAAYGMLIQKYLYTSDIVFGTAVSYREGDMRNAENVVGNFINIIPLRLRGNGNLSLLETIMGVQADLIDRNAYNHTSYFDIRQMMGLQPSESLFDSVLVIENYPLDKSIKRNDRDYQVSLHSLYENTGMPLLVTVFLDEGLRIDYTYNIDRIPDELVSVLSSQLPLIIRSILNSPLELAGAVSILTEKERNEILYEFNNTEVSYPKNKTIVELFEKQVEKTPGKCAIFSVSESITYNELNKRINRLAHFLKYNGVKKGGIVGILMDRSIDFVINVFAVVKAGALYLPIDAGYPDERINYMLENSEANVLLTKEEILKGKNVKEGSVIFCYDKLLQELNALADSNPPAQEVEDIYVLYTSGSTGLPKGVVGTEKGLINRLYWGWDKYPINDDDVFCLKTNIGFGDHVVEMFSPLLSGTPVRVFGEEEILNITVMYSLLIREKITRITLVPTYLKALIDQMREEEPRTHALKYVFCSGEALPFQQAKDFYRVFHGVQLVNIYGSTEVSADATSYDVERGYVDDGSLDLRDNEIIDEPRNLYSKKIPIGKPISNTTAYILDENYNPVPIGVCGELYVGGSGVARGYLNNADLSSEKFVSDPYRKGDRMYRTGDLGRWRSDGTIEFLGRRDDQVKIRGHRIEPGEIAVHVNGYAGIGDAVVQVRERGGEKYLVCYYVSSDVIREDDLQEYLSFRLPEYMIPGRYIRLESIPLTSSGKVDRKKLPEPEIINVDNYIAPANAVEEKLVEIWSEVLQIDKGVISTDSGFFRLGGHSLKAMALANKISRQLHVEVPLKEIFLRQDIRGLCAFIQGSSNSGYSGISKADAAESYPLSSSQKRMYFLYEFDKLSVAYNMPVVLELEGELDLRRISGAFGGLISRHESLRTTFGSVNGQVAQRIHAASGFNLEWYESEGVDAGPVIRRFIRPFELERGPLFRAGVVRRGQSSHLLLVDMHHIITDGVSQGILIRDFMSLYNNEVLPELRLEYKDYSVWQQGPAQQERLLGQRDFWKGEFSEGVSLLNLPCDHPRPAVKSYQGSNRSFMLDAEDTSGLRQLGEGSGATLFMTVLSVFNVFLSKLSNEEDITVGTATAGRYHAELEGIIGLFVNTLALRNQATGSLSFREFLSVVKERTLSCFDNQLYPYEELINELELSRDTSRSPLFDVMFSYQNFGHKDLEIPGLKLKPGANEHNISKFDLTLTATETEGKLHLNFEYSTSLFEGETIDRFMSYFGLLVKAVIADADRSLSELDMLPEGERYQLLYGFNDTATDYPKDRTITDLFEEQVEKTPDHVAVVNEGKTVTYRQLLERVNQITDFLGSRSTGGDIIAVFADRTIDTIASMIAILKNGSAYLPVDIKLPAERVRYMLNDAEVKIILTNVAIPEEIRREYIVHDISLIETEPGTYVEKPVRFTTSEDVAYVMYTSGTTGLPKGVMISNRNISGLVINSDYVELNETTRILLTGMLSFDATTFEIWGSLLNGGAVYLFPEDTLLDTEQLGSIMESCEINTMFLTTALYNFHVQEKVSIFKGLKYLLVGGEVLSPYHINRVHDLYPSVHLINCYGPTENTTFSVCHSIVERYEQHIPIGKPISNTTAYILDENYNPVPIGVCGELYVGGSGVARGYLNNADLSSEKFVSDPYRKGDRMYRTGDLGRWRSDGTIEFLGRRDDQVKIRGHRIEPGEIAVHVNGYAGIGDAVVQVRERGGEKYLVCYYVSSDVIREDDLQEYLSFRLPEYMIPGRYIRLESIPLTSSGKVDRKKLPEPEIINVDNYIAPANAVEEKLVEIWSEVLQIDKGVISTDSVFFRLGGHSLKAMALANKISRQLHVEVPLKEIFLRQDIRGLCAFIQGSSNSGYSGISKADAAESYPLSSSQKRMYFLYEFDKLSVAYNMPVVLELEGELDLRRISGAFGGLISRHESLRTTFGSVNGQVAQRIHAASGFNLEWYESEGVDAGPVIRRFIRPFELERGPLFRAGVVRRGQSSHLLLVDMHHIITDGVSQGILIRDFMSLYNNEVLPELRLEYKDYSVWQQGPAQQERLLGQRDFWKGEFSEGVSLLNLPCDHPRPAVKSYQGSNRSFMLDAEDTSGLRQLGEGSGATLFMTVLSVFNVFLSKLSNEEDITVGTATAGRYHAELEGIIGLFVNTLALRNQATGSLSFREFLSVVKERTLSCFDNQLYPYEELINELELSRDTSRSPLFDVMFSYQNFGHKDLEIPGLKLKPGANEHNISKFDLTLTATETEGKLHLNFEYSTSLFEGETIDRFMSYFGLLVKAVIADADRSLSELDMLPEGERYQLLYGFNDTATDYPKDRTITDLFEEQVEKTPDHVAVVFKEEQLTYKALNEKSNQLARYLLSAGIVPGNVVGLLLNRSLEMAIGIIGILKAGAIYMPIEPSLPEQRIKYMLDQSGTRLLLTHDQYLGQNYTDCRVMDINSAAGYGGNKENLYVKTGPEDLAYCIFTSGSTGLPKGVMVGNQSVVNLVTGLEKKVYKYYNDKPLHVALLASCIFDVSLQPIFGSLLLGHCLYICDEQDRKDGNRLIDFYNNNDIDLSDGTPTHLRLVVESLDKKINLKSLSSWILAGEILPKELVREFYDRIGDREIKLFDFYGPTETCVYSTCFEIIRDELDAYPTIPIGSPLPNERIYITDKYGSLTPTGVAGELCIAGDGLAKCYVGNAGLTSEKFREDWISNGERVYRTGDLARWLPDGNIEYLGRTDSQVKIRGYRIELGEIESWLTGYEGIKNAVVLVKEKDENKYLAAYFISEKDIKPEMLRNYLAEHLPEYMLPAHYVRIDSMPLTSSGKIDRNAFPEIGLGTSDNYIAPANAVEEKLAEIWSEVLQIDKGVISTDSGFFRLGGHSLKAMALANKISRQLHVEVPLKEIFLRQDIRGLCAFIQGSSNSGYSGISKADAAESYPLSSSQKRMYFLYEFDKLSVAYNMPVVLELEGELDHRRISGAFGGLISRHESLRTTFESVNGQVAQRIHAASGFNLEWYESEGVDAGPVIRRFIRPFELERGPLFRAGVVRRGQSSHLLLVDMHHIITDGVSQGILIRDFMSLYNNEVLPELRLEYKDYSVWQQGPAQQERLLGQRDFWKGEFSEGVSLLNLPCDHPRPAVKSYQGSNRSFMLDAEDTSGLRQLGEGSGATLFMTVLSVFNVFLSKLSNEEDITVGTATAGRYHAELEGIIGLFVNTLALRNQASGSLSFREFLSVVKERTLSCFDNQLYTYEELINELELPRDTSRSPLFDVMFSYQNFGHKDLEIPGLKLKPGANEHNISKFDLTLTATETEGKLHLNFEYSTSLFEAETIDRFMSYFGLLVKAVIADADRSLSELDMLPEGERYQLLYGFNDTATDYPKDRTITDLFEEQVEKTPDHVAVVFKEEQLTYKALNEKSNQLARYLLSAGIVPGNVVGLLLNRSLEMAIGIIGILKAGAIYMPIEPSLPEQRIKYMLDQSGTRLLLTHDQYLGQNYTDCRVMDINSAAGYGGNKENLYVKTGPEDLAYCIFTSGSTGLPKGVMVGNQSVVNLVTGLEKKVYKYYNDKPLHVALLASYAFDASLQQIFGSLLLGHCLYICDEQDRKDGNRLIDFYNNNDIDLSDGTPTHLRLVVESLDKKINLKSLSSWILAGEILPKELVREFYDRIGDREIKLFNFYGPTETCVDSTCFEIIRDELDAYPTIPIGSPLPNERIYITDKYGSLTPTGVAGELCIAGDGLAKCYVGNAGLTSEKFREDWISNGERVYRTGDLARWLPDGNIEYLGRTDSQVKIRGYRIELGEIESWLTGYEGIKNAVVLVKEKDENKYLAAYFISEKDIKPEMLRNYLAEHLPEYMLPAHYVRIDSMPLTSSGKIDRNAFPEIGLGTSDNYIAPVTREEQLLCEVWSRVLGVKRIGITDNFFSLGGDSIKSIQVCSRMRIAGYKVTVQEIFYNQTIDKLAVQLKGIEKVSDQTSVNGEVGLTGIQQKFFEGERLRKNHYNQSVMLNFQDRLTLDEVREIFGVIQDHHDALRMVYRGGEKQVVQYNRGPGQPVFVNYFDLQDNISPREKLYSISNELQSGIDLEQGPLLKLGLFDLIDGSRLLIVIHHLVTDGISWRILFEDIKTLYQQLKRGEILKLPPKTDSFKLWSQKLRSDYIGGKRYTSAVAYWTSILIQDGVDITSGNTVTENTIGEGANSGFRLEKSLTEKLLGEVHSTFNTQINDILLAGFLMSVNKHYGTGALQMDLEGHGREDIIPGMDMSRTIGWFTSVYPVVLKQTEDGLPGLIKSVKETLRGVPNKGIDYLIAKYLSGDIRSDASSRIIFNYLGQVDSDTGEEVFSIATESTGLNASPEEQREYAWDVSAIVTNDELHMQISYSISQYDQLMMDELMVSYKASLEELIAYCLSHGKRELTPSDLTYKGLTISQLEKLQDKLTKYEF